MKVLLDECLPLDLRHAFIAHEVRTAEWAGFKGKRNGELLRLAEQAGYDVFVTIDRGIPFQQSLPLPRLSVVAIKAKSKQLEDLLPIVPAIIDAFGRMEPGSIVNVGQ